MDSYLLDHAIRNVWCNPAQDHQHVIQAQRITPPSGGLRDFKVANRHIKLPTAKSYYHVYQIGQINPSLIGLLSDDPTWVTERWISCREAINTLKVTINLYNVDGIELPRFKSWFMFSDDRALLIAVEDHGIYKVKFQDEYVYMRVYTNAYFQSQRSDQSKDILYCDGTTIDTEAKIDEVRIAYLGYRAKPGYTYVYINGYLCNNIDLSTVRVGDIVEYVYDSSVKKVVTFDIKTLPVFRSIRDLKYKYLLHYPLSEGDISTIDFYDDNDIHVLIQYGSVNYRGRYYHRNAVDSVRMVTHRDYSIVVNNVDQIAQSFIEDFRDVDVNKLNFKIQLKIRKSGYERPLTFDNLRIFELYKLSDTQIMQALTGVNASMVEWHASTLENSEYVTLMGTPYQDLTLEMVEKAYGYNAISKILGDTPSKVSIGVTSTGVVTLPYGLRSSCMVYEYDKDGYLISYHRHNNGSEYICRNVKTSMVEAIYGAGSYNPHVVFGRDNIQMDMTNNYRVYMSIPTDGVFLDWDEITGSDLYVIEDGKLQWRSGIVDYQLMIRYDDAFLAYTLAIVPRAGTCYFTLSEMEDRGDGLKNHTLPVPMGELDIFLNGKSLIRGLDYHVEFPMVYIVNKTHLIQPSHTATQQLHVRFTGFCGRDRSMDTIEDFGFIEHGVLSNNTRYDIRDDKVLRITVDGGVKDRSSLVFSETHTGISVVNALNGKPYQVKDIVIPFKDYTKENTYSLRAKSMEIDRHVSDFMTVRLPQPPRDGVSSITERYPLISPFITHIVNDLVDDRINMSIFDTQMTDQDIINACQPYEHILKFDPIYRHDKPDSRYVIIHPHGLNNVVHMSLIKYRFLKRVVAMYGNDLVELSPFISFDAG